ncbi:MAG TPA: helix-turn-helix domain-containing protein, partial [Fimbriiglobus sp.]
GGAAHRLGLNPTTLYGKMRKHGIRRTDEPTE